MFQIFRFLKQSLNRLLSHRLFLAFYSLSAGTLAGQVISLLALPFVSRLYSPEDFGVLSLIIATTSIVIPAVGLKFEFAIYSPSSRRELRALVGLAILSVLLISLIWSLFVLSAASLFIGSQKIEFLGLWVFGILVGTGLFNVFVQIAIRERDYKGVGTSSIVQSGTTAFGQTTLGVFNVTYPGLLSGLMLGQAVSLSYLIHRYKKVLGNFRINELPNLFMKYWRFPAVFAPSAILNSIGSQLPLITISALFGLSATGQLGMAERIVAIPIALVGGAIGQLFVGEISKMRREALPNFVSFYLKITLVLVATSSVLFGALILVSPWLIPLLLGSKWESAVPLIQIIAFMGAIRLAFSPTSMALTIFQRARANFLLDLSRVVIVLLAVIFVTITGQELFEATAILYGALSVIYLVTWIYVFLMLRNCTLR